MLKSLDLVHFLIASVIIVSTVLRQWIHRGNTSDIDKIIKSLKNWISARWRDEQITRQTDKMTIFLVPWYLT